MVYGTSSYLNRKHQETIGLDIQWEGSDLLVIGHPCEGAVFDAMEAPSIVRVLAPSDALVTRSFLFLVVRPGAPSSFSLCLEKGTK